MNKETDVLDAIDAARERDPAYDGLHIILLNGPPRSGKDTAAIAALHWLAERTDVRGSHFKFSAPIKRAVQAFYGLTPRQMVEMDKDKPSWLLFDAKSRDAQIAMGESYAKGLHGKQVFGAMMVREIKTWFEIVKPQHNKCVAVISDCGFVEEVEPLEAAFHGTRLHFVRIFREGCTFENDSRSFITSPTYWTELNNDGTAAQFDRVVEDYLTGLVDG